MQIDLERADVATIIDLLEIEAERAEDCNEQETAEMLDKLRHKLQQALTQ